jgi:hypothetical protein
MDFAGTALWVVVLLIVIWLVLLVTSINSLVKRRDISLPVKIFWGAVISLAPVVGLILYVVFGRKTAPST